jgi:hypothetical protein
MPGFDGTGPLGQGPRTGGGFGYCPPVGEPTASGAPVVYGAGRGGLPRGGGRGFAFGGGRGRRFGGAAPAGPGYAPDPASARMTAEQEVAWLQEQAQLLQEQLNQTNARIEDLTANQQPE